MKFHYNPCKYWCFGIFCFKILVFDYNGWVLEENTAFYALEVSITNPHKEFACFPTIPQQKWSNRCIFQALCSYIWEILPFSLQKWFWGYFAKGIWWNFAYFPTKIVCFMYYICVLSNHCIKLKFYAFACLL